MTTYNSYPHITNTIHSSPKEEINVLSITEKDSILRSLFLGRNGELDSSFLYKGKGAELYEKISNDTTYPYINIEINALNKLKNNSKIKNILKKTEYITDVGCGDGQKAVALLEGLSRRGTYILEDFSRKMIEVAENFIKKYLPNLNLGSSQKLNNGKHLSQQLSNNMYLFLGGTICNMSDREIINELKGMDNSGIFTGNRILLSYFTAPNTQEEIDNLIKIYNSPANKEFHENGMKMLGLSMNDFEYDTVYQKDDPTQKSGPFPGKIKGIIRAKKDTSVRLSNGEKIEIKQGQEFTLHYSRRFTQEGISKLFKESGCKTEFTISEKGDTIVLLKKAPTKSAGFIEKYRNKLLTSLITLGIGFGSGAWYHQHKQEQEEQRQMELKAELELAHKSLDKSHLEEVNELIIALKLDDLKDNKNKKAIIDLFSNYLRENGNGNTDDDIKGFYKKYGRYLIENFGLTHSPYDFMTYSLMINTKNFGDELSFTPLYTFEENNKVNFGNLSNIDYGILKASILGQGTFKPYSFEYKDGEKTYLILKLKIQDSFKGTFTGTEIYVGAEKNGEDTHLKFSSEVILYDINDKSGLNSEILKNTCELGGNFYVVNNVDSKGYYTATSNNPYITLFNTDPNKIINIRRINGSNVDYNKLNINGKTYYVIKFLTYSGEIGLASESYSGEIGLASESPSGPYSTSTFNEIAKYFSIKRDMPLGYVPGHRRWR